MKKNNGINLKGKVNYFNNSNVCINYDFLLSFHSYNNILTIASLKYNKSLTNIFE
jgi:hypothetical protein